jgi:hypothetical protein
MIRCDTVHEAVAHAVRLLGKRVFAMSPIGVGSGNEYLNALAGLARRGEIDLSVLAALTFETPPRPSGESTDPLTAIHRRLNEGYIGFSYLEECVAAAREGRPAPDYCTYYSYYYLPGLGRRVAGIQNDYLGVNFRDVNEAALTRGLNMIVMKASRRGAVFNCGTNVDVMLRGIYDVKKNGGMVMLLENEEMPYSLGNAEIPESLVDCVVRSNEPLFIMPHQPLTVLEHAIGSNVSDIVDDGATLQIGIGQMADAVAYWLAKKGRTGLSGYSELVSPAFHYLVREGVITRRGANGALVTGAFAVGGRDLYRYINENPDVWMTGVHETNNRDHISRLPKFHGINSTLQMDLFSQASSEGFFSEGRYVQYTGMGGQFEFQESAMKSPGGKSILCLRSCWRDDSGEPRSSNILPVLKNVVGVPRNKMDYVVTEYGSRCLRFRSIGDRARAMIELADSRFQGDLLNNARTMGLVESGYEIPDEFRNNTYESVMERFGDIARANRFPLGRGFDLAGLATDEERALLESRDECVA